MKFNISLNIFVNLIQLNCFYCGMSPSKNWVANVNRKNYCAKPLIYNGIDRLDSNDNYDINNVVTSCIICNRGKNNSSYEEFMNWIHKIVNYQKVFQFKTPFLFKINEDICCKNEPKPNSYAQYNKLYMTYKSGAKNRKIDFLLSFDEFKSIIVNNCYYCGTLPHKIGNYVTTEYSKNNPIFHNGIDRIDSDCSYTINNCVPCCIICNRIKSNMLYSEFINYINKLIIKYKVSLIIRS